MNSKDKKPKVIGEVWYSMKINSRDVFERADYDLSLTYTSERFLVIEFNSTSSLYKGYPKRKVTRFRKHPNTRKIFERLKKYFPSAGHLENGFRLEISGDTLLTDDYLDFIEVQLDIDSFDQVRDSIPVKKRKFLVSKNKEFRKEWQVDLPAVLIVNGVEHFCVGNAAEVQIYNSRELVELFANRIFYYSHIVDGYQQRIIFSQFMDGEAVAYFQGTFGREYFFYSGPLVLNFYRFFRRLFNFQYPQSGFAQLIKVALNSIDEVWTFQSGDLFISMNASGRDVALLKEIIHMNNYSHESLQNGVKKVSIRDESGRVVATLAPIHRNSDGGWSHGMWRLKSRSDDGKFLSGEVGTAMEGILSVTGGSNFAMSTVQDYQEFKWKRARTLYGKPALLTFDSGSIDSGSIEIEDCPLFKVKFDYVRTTDSLVSLEIE